MSHINETTESQMFDHTPNPRLERLKKYKDAMRIKTRRKQPNNLIFTTNEYSETTSNFGTSRLITESPMIHLNQIKCNPKELARKVINLRQINKSSSLNRKEKKFISNQSFISNLDSRDKLLKYKIEERKKLNTRISLRSSKDKYRNLKDNFRSARPNTKHQGHKHNQYPSLLQSQVNSDIKFKKFQMLRNSHSKSSLRSVHFKQIKNIISSANNSDDERFYAKIKRKHK